MRVWQIPKAGSGIQQCGLLGTKSGFKGLWEIYFIDGIDHARAGKGSFTWLPRGFLPGSGYEFSSTQWNYTRRQECYKHAIERRNGNMPIRFLAFVSFLLSCCGGLYPGSEVLGEYFCRAQVPRQRCLSAFDALASQRPGFPQCGTSHSLKH